MRFLITYTQGRLEQPSSALGMPRSIANTHTLQYGHSHAGPAGGIRCESTQRGDTSFKAGHLEDGRAEGGGEVLLHVGGQGGAPAHDEAHAAAKRALEGAEDVLVQQRRRLHNEVCTL